MPNRRVDSRSDSQIIYEGLRAGILRGDPAPGTVLREVAVAENFGVSRTPAREAIARLLHEQLLVRSERGSVVRAPDPGEVIQVYDLRILLEQEAAAQAAHMRSEVDLAQLEGLVTRDQALDDPNDATRQATNMEFHGTLWRASHNTVLEDLLKRLSMHIAHVPHSTLSVGGRWEESLAEHHEIVMALAARDEIRARELLRMHMTTARSLRLSLLRGNTSTSSPSA